MANTAPVAYSKQFSDKIIMQAQQMGSKLSGAVDQMSQVGETATIESLGATEAQDVNNFYAPKLIIDPQHSRRIVTTTPSEWNTLFSDLDKVRMILDPVSNYAQAAAAALGRKVDQKIIAALKGNATGQAADGTLSSIALPGTQQVGKDIGGGNSNLNIDKLAAARKILMANNVDVNFEQLFLVVNASAYMALVQEDKAASSDYSAHKTLVNGNITQFMGFNIIHSELVNGTNAGTSGDPQQILCFAKSGIVLSHAKPLSVTIDTRNDLTSNPFQVSALQDNGSTRKEEEKVVTIDCVNA